MFGVCGGEWCGTYMGVSGSPRHHPGPRGTFGLRGNCGLSFTHTLPRNTPQVSNNGRFTSALYLHPASDPWELQVLGLWCVHSSTSKITHPEDTTTTQSTCNSQNSFTNNTGNHPRDRSSNFKWSNTCAGVCDGL